MNRLWVTTLIVVAALASGVENPAWSAPPGSPPGLQMEAEAAFDGYFKYGEWLPVWVRLENSGPDLEAEVQVRVTGSWGATTFAAPAPLPSGSRKRIPIYVLPNNFSRFLEVRLLADGEELLSREVPVNPQANVSYLVGLVTPERGGLSFIAGASLPGRERPKTLIDLSLADLPGRREGLRSFDCLVLNDTDTSSLTPEQRMALETWVRQGGRLVIGGGRGATLTTAGLPDTILPFLPKGEIEAGTLPSLADFAGAGAIRVSGPFVVSTGQETIGRTLAAQGELPLVRERIMGDGFVDFVALDLAVSPFDAWAGSTSFWGRLLSPGAAYPEWLPPDMSAQQMKSGQMTSALARLPALDLPSIRGLGVLLMLYVVLVGPVNYLVLRWRKRLHWAWLSVPAITLIFSAGAFSLGYALRGTDLILNEIAIIQLRQDGTADTTGYVGLFSPARRSYEIEVRGENLLSPLIPDYNPWGPEGVSGAGEMVFVQGDPGRVRGLAVNQWSMQTFMMEDVRVDLGYIVGDLRLEDETLVGIVRNRTDYMLTDASLVLGQRFVRLGDLQPGQGSRVSMDLPDLAKQGLGQPLSFLLFQDQLAQSGSGSLSREADLKRMLVQSVFEPSGQFGPMPLGIGSSGGGRSLQGLMFLGWLDETPLDVRVAGRTPTQQATALLYAPLSFGLADEGDLSIPPGLISGMLVEMPTEGGLCGPNAASVWLGRGEAIFEFQAPQEVRDVQVDILKLIIREDGGGWWQPPDTAVYAWDRKTWVAVDNPVIGSNVISDAANLVSDDGLIRLRLATEGNRAGCFYLELGLEGQR
ncbi:MAG: hypothetical protein JSV81_19160 [Anaerolineales bacterium]|nr:MAG: hypothetical protein JSV81_19160 [Anaerolineales bacterium]